MNPYPYLVIDLKSFYASVECVERGLDPMTANLVVADPKRSAGTLCLAITPSMKRLGISNRCRLYEIPNHISYLVAEPKLKICCCSLWLLLIRPQENPTLLPPIHHCLQK